MATLAQTVGHIIITTLAWLNFSQKMDKIRLITLEINFNVGLFVCAFIYYYFELQQRMTAFTTWKAEQVNCNKINILGTELLETAFAFNSCWNCNK